jgi:hypothetical protein
MAVAEMKNRNKKDHVGEDVSSSTVHPLFHGKNLDPIHRASAMSVDRNAKRPRCTSSPLPATLPVHASSDTRSASATIASVTKEHGHEVSILGLDESESSGTSTASAAALERVVVSAPVTRPYLQNAEIHWKQFVYKTSQIELAHFQSSRFDVYLDDVQSGEESGNPLVVPLPDDIFVDEREMFSFFDYMLRVHPPLNKRNLNIDGHDGGKEVWLDNIGLPMLTRMCQLAAHFNLTPGIHHEFLKTLQKRAPGELSILEALALAQTYVDPVLLRRTARRLANYVYDKDTGMAVTLINSISDATVAKLIPVVGVGIKALPKRTKFSSTARQSLWTMLVNHAQRSRLSVSDTDSDATSDEDDEGDEGDEGDEDDEGQEAEEVEEAAAAEDMEEAIEYV